MIEDVVRFNAIEVVESLPAGEMQTGTDLFEAVIQPLAFPIDPPIHVRLQTAANSLEFFEALDRIRDDTLAHRRSPILHIEAHGGSDGLLLASGERVVWMDLLQHVTEINVASKLNLVLAMSACFGADVARLMHPAHRAPFWSTVGAASSISAGALFAAFSAFYRTYLTLFDGGEAVFAMRAAQTPETERMAFRVAEIWFRLIFFDYVRTQSDGQALADRVDRLFEAIAEEHPDAREREADVRAWIRTNTLDHEVHFERFRETFFMVDLYPENRERFPVRFEDGPPWALGRQGDVP